MPVSRVRKKKTSPQVQFADAERARLLAQGEKVNPKWFLPVMLGLMVLGLVWIVVFYLTAGSARLPIPGIGNWNLAIGFLLILAGFGMTTQWR